ncbi:bifunctional lytic transglycosylase/C40 family peptidase [Streptacidiphilus cavernicola]|uniref:NlpC/P60 family protein n=1 Tax=Streptacidiphilus cavernicola TaxID=3342716 RepID=A0ABV6W2F4_9ACTN
MTLRRAWSLVGGGGMAAAGVLLFLVVGTYSASGSLDQAQAQGAVQLAPGTVPASYAPLIQKWGTLCPELTPPLLAAQMYQESGFNPKAVSPVGAQGMAQFMPATWAIYGVDPTHTHTPDVWNPADAIPSAATYDCQLAKDTSSVPGNHTANMLAAYNAGPYAVIKAGGVPPYKETQGYVSSITKLAQSFTGATVISFSAQAAGAIYYAQQKLGTPYLWGGEGLASQGYRFDCSGLTQAAFASVGITLPRVAADQWYAGPHPSRSQLQPGDLVFFSHDPHDPAQIHHVGIYVGGGMMINAPHTGAVIRYDAIDSEGDYFGATRVTAGGADALPTLQPGGGIANGGALASN